MPQNKKQSIIRQIFDDNSTKQEYLVMRQSTINRLMINKILERKIVSIFLPIIFNITFECSYNIHIIDHTPPSELWDTFGMFCED